MKIMKKIQFNIVSGSLIIILCLMFSVEATAATYYAGPSGSGATCSSSSPCTVQTGIGKLRAGDTLYLKNGIYIETSGMINVTTLTNGTQTNPIIIAAENDGAVTLDGSGAGVRPIAVGGSWIIVEGMNAHGMPSSFDSVVKIYGSNDTIRRVIAWDVNAAVNNAHIFIAHQSTNALFEDVAGWGRGRKVFAVQGDSGTTYRRCFGMWSGFIEGEAIATDGLNTGYNSSSSNRDIYENCIMTADRNTGTYTGAGIAIIGGSAGNSGSPKLYGNIIYSLPDQVHDFYGAFRFVAYAYPVDLTDSIVYIEGNDVKAIAGSKNTVNITYDYVTTIGGGLDLEQSILNHHLNKPSITSLGGDILQYRSSTRPSSGAWIKYRYENGKLTNKPLWPWPMNERIRKAMVASGYDRKGGLDGKGGTDLTKTVFELGGGTMPSFDIDAVPNPPTLFE